MVLQDALQGIQEIITCFEMVKTSVASSALCHFKGTCVFLYERALKGYVYNQSSDI